MKNLFLFGVVCLLFVSCGKDAIAPSVMEESNTENTVDFRSAGPNIVAAITTENCCRESKFISLNGSRNVHVDLDQLTDDHYNASGGLRYLFYQEVGGSYILRYNFQTSNSDPTFCVRANRDYKIIIYAGSCGPVPINISGCSYNWVQGQAQCTASPLYCVNVPKCGGITPGTLNPGIK